MRSILIIAMLLGVIKEAEALDRGKWIEQTAKASKTCEAKFRKKFGEGNGHSFADCITDTKITKQWIPVRGTASLPIVFGSDH